MRWLNPITDRTHGDLENKTAKSFFNLCDWKRIYTNTIIIRDFLQVYSGISSNFVALKEPEINTIPLANDINLLVQNIEYSRITFLNNFPPQILLSPLFTNYLGGSSFTVPNYLIVNQWEMNLSILRISLLLYRNFKLYCGMFQAGEPRYFQNRFLTFKEYIAPKPALTRFARIGISICGVKMTRNNSFRRY